MPHFKSFVHVLLARAQEDPERRAFTYLNDGELDEQGVTFGALDRAARAIGAYLQASCAPGARVVLLYPPGIAYVAAFFGCLYGNVVAVPAYPPDPSRLTRTLPRLQAIVGDAGAELVLTTSLILSMTEGLSALAPELGRLRWVATDALDDRLANDWRPVDVDERKLAFLQYTSGSTGTPKGVMLTHGNLLANELAIQNVFKLDRSSVGVGWLPLYHDMGLIGNVLQTVYVGFHCVLMSPLDFLQRPMRWLEAISRFGGTTSGGPNFAYDLCVRKVRPEDRERLDLGTWSVAFCGAEPVRRETLDRFAQAFAGCGFRKESFLPCYGLAEATLLVSGKATGTDYRVARLDARALEEGRAVPSASVASSRELVSCGRGVEGTSILLVDPVSRRPCAGGRVGEVWVSGPHVAVGYWADPEQSARTFQAELAAPAAAAPAGARFLRTGDLGFEHEGELFLSGRLKDLLIVRGRNYYPQDIERAVEEASPLLRQGGAAAFSVEIEGEERVVVAAEVARSQQVAGAPVEAVFEAIRRAVSEDCAIHLHAVVLVKPGGIPKTSSGKIQRHACKAGFLGGSLDVLEARTSEGVAAPPEGLLSVADLERAADASRLSLIERFLQAELSRVLRVAPATIDLSAPLSAIGLDSLMAVDVGYAVERSLGVVLPATALLREGSGRDLSSKILSMLASRPAAPLPAALSPVTPSPGRPGDEPQLPLSAGQESLWFLHELAGDSAAYNIGTAFEVRGEVSADALTAAFQALLEHHPALLTTFAQVGDGLVQRSALGGAASFRVDVVDAAGWSDEEVRVRASDEADRPFDIERGPVFRATLLSRGPRDHVLVLAAHHIAADLWSIVILLSDLRALYPAARGGESAPALPGSARYEDFVSWQQRYLGAEGEADWEYWRARLEDVPALDLPTERPRPAVKTYRGGVVPVRLPEQLTAKVAELARQERTTSFTVLLACFEILLARYSGQESFLVGSPVAGRPRQSFERTVGYFVNPLPLRADLSGEPTAREVLRRTRDVVLSGLEHQSFPFARMVERLSTERDPSRSPLFQAMFVLEKAYLDRESDLTMLALNASAGTADFAGLELRAFDLLKRSARFDLTLSLAHGTESLGGMFEYNADLFDRDTIERMVTHFEALLGGLLDRPDEVVWKLPLLTEAEKRRLLVAWQGKAADVADERCVHEIVEDHAARRPDALAVQHGHRALTYAELNGRANQLARWLRKRGVGLESRVVTWLDRSPEMVIAALAVIKAGGAYVPADPSYPLARVAFTARDSGARVVLSTHGVADRWGDPFGERPGDGALVCLDDPRVQDALAGESAEDPRVVISRRNAAYMIYTSGTTGQPKGSVIEHGQLAALVSWYHRHYGARPEDRLSQIAGPAFDASVYELWPALLGGASLHVVDDETRLSPERLREWLVSRRITLAWVPTNLAEQLLDELDWRGSTLRYLLAAGDRLTRRPSAHHPFVLTNGYGPSECTIQATVAEVGADPSGRAPSIGTPIDGSFVYILDARFEPTPIGVPGELLIGGDSVGRGYANLPALTAEKFVPDPFRPRPGARMYRTGDAARFLPDGTIEFVGRLDYQVKVRGFRIELGEIESALLQHESVREAVVLAREDAPGRRRLIAYVTAKDGVAPPTAAALTARLKVGLPEYMLPSAIVVMAALPLTRNGKVDRKALPPADTLPGAAEHTAPRDAIEDRLCRIVAEVLGLPRVGVHDKFFEAGASSLDLMKIRHRLERELGVHVPLTSFFEHPTLGELAAVVRSLELEQAGRREADAGAGPSAGGLANAPAAPALQPIKVAIIGMAGRFPGAANVAELWDNILLGRDCITRFEPRVARVSPLVPEGAEHPRFVGAEGVLDAIGVDQELWRPSADTRGLDLQSKLFVDAVLAAFEDAGHDPWAYPGRVALYGGASSVPLVEAIVGHSLARRGSALWAQMTLAPDTLPMRAAHTFGFRGEAMSVNTACSTGLSVVHLACQSLLLGHSDVAVAVAANVASLQGTGYVYEEGMILSKDGRVRPFDANASGVVLGHGVGAVLLKPLEAAIRDGDPIYAVIRATATNNDGSAKVGYTAPGVGGQIDVIAAAHSRAQISADEVGYVETHGTGTDLGDPVEVTALTKAFRRSTDRSGFCALGAVKANVGHLDSAAGLVGLIKTALVLHREVLPPLANFEAPNPELELPATPFTIPTAARAWKRGERPRIAGVSSFGIGGTNVHAVLEEAPAHRASSSPSRGFFVLDLGARTEAALDALCGEVASILESASPTEVADLTYTLNTRRLRWPVTRAAVAADGAALARTLRGPRRARAATKGPVELAFVYAGMGSNPAGLGASLYFTEPTFQEHVDACQERLARAGFDVRWALTEAPVNERLPAGLSGAALFTFETAIERLLSSWGLRPSCVIGHSFGECAAAVSSGVLSLDDALGVVAARCDAMQAMPEGAMLVATCTTEAALDLARRMDVEIAAFNGPSATVFCGAPASIERLQKELRGLRVATMRLGVDRALHSRDVDAVLPRVAGAFSAVSLKPPSTRFVSTVHGALERDGLTAPSYWVAQMRRPVRFADALRAAHAAGANVLVEIGPTGGLVPVMAGNLGAEAICLPAFQGGADARALYELVGRLLDLGVPVDWAGFYAGESRRRVQAPLHPRPHAEPVFGNASSRSAAPPDPPQASPVPQAPPLPPAPAPLQAPPPKAAPPPRPIAKDPLEPAPGATAMSTSIEHRVAALWKQALKLEAVDPQAHFLELGGSSLLAVQLVADMRDEFRLDLGLAEVFAAPTVEALAQLISTRVGESQRVELPSAPLAPAPEPPVSSPRPVAVNGAHDRRQDDPTPAPSERALSAVQRRVFAADADPGWGPAVVNMVGAIRLRGPIDLQRLARALKAVVRRHEVLHTKFARLDAAVTLDSTFRASDVQLTSVWCDADGAEARLAEVRSAIAGRLAQRFDLAREIPIRAFMFHLDEDDQVLALIIHHMAVDAPSLRIILQETLQSYHGVALAEDAPRYSAFAARQEAEILGKEGAAHAAALGALIDRSPRLRALIDADAGARADASLSFPLGPEIGAAIADLRKRHGLSTFVVVAAALALTLRDSFRSTELIVSTPFGNRDRPEHAGLVGYVAHCMVMELHLGPEADARALAEVQRAFAEALRHASVPFEHAVLSRDERARPLSDICLVVHEEHEQPLRFGGLEVTPFSCEVPGEPQPAAWVATMGTAGFLVHLRPDGSGGRMSFCFPRDLLGAEANDIPRRVAAVLERLASGPKVAPAASLVPAPSSAPRSPLALRLDGIALSHGELAALTATIESRLRERGVAAGSVVGVDYRNRAELVCAAIAILRSGAHATIGRAGAELTLTFGSEGAGGKAIALSLDMPRGSERAARFDHEASPITAQSVKRASDILREASPTGGAHVIWDGALPDNRAVAFAVAALEGRGLVSDLPAVVTSARTVTAPVPLSLAYFPVDERANGADTYRLLLEGTKLADEAGLRAVFTPERHFHPFGGAFPDPLVAAAALAGVTKRIQLRAGSIVLPLHDPVRVAESWGMLDVISGGRVGLSIATGWRMEDFVLAPAMFARRKEALQDLIETLRALWRGESVERPDPEGRPVRIRTRPRPLQPELPVWLTCAGSPASFALAGELGTAIFTMLATNLEGLADNIAEYRRSFARRWDGATGHVTVLVSTFVHRDDARAREIALAPLERYLGWSLDIGMKESATPIAIEAQRRFLRQKAEKVVESEGLIGDLAACRRRVEALVSAGADEIACLVDFGVPHDEALRGIEGIAALADQAPARSARWVRLPAPVPLEHRGRPEVWLLAKSSAAVTPAAHRRVLVEDEQLIAEVSSPVNEHPLSGIQLGIYLDELRFAKATYNNPFVVRVTATLDADRLRRAIGAASLRHDMLRSRFVHKGERVVRVIDAEPKVDLRVIEGCGDEAAVVARARADAAERFDLSSDHPLRVHLYPSASGASHLLLCLHHIAGDVVSGFLVLRDILRAYDASPADPWSGTETKVTYAEVAALREAASSERERRMQRWLAQIAGAPTVVEWPTSRPRPARLSGEGVQISRVVPRERVEALRAAARGCRVTVPTFLFSVLQALLHVKTRRRELLVGAVSLGRNNPAWLDVVGPLFNMLPVRSSVAPGCTFEQLAQRTGTALVDTMVEDQIGFAEIVQRGQVPTTLDRSPLVQFLFNYIPKQGVADGADAGVTQIDVDWGIATFDVDVSARERGDDLVLTVKWSTDALDADEGAAFIAAFDRLLACVVEDPRTVLLPPEAPPLEDGSAAFWKAELAGAPRGVGLEIEGPSSASGRACERSPFDLPADTARALLDLANRNHAPPIAAFLAAFALLLQRHSGQSDLVLASLASAPSERKLEAVVGAPGAFTMVRARMEGDPTFEELVGRIARAYAAAVVHQPLSASEVFGTAQRDETESGIGVMLALHERARGGAQPTGRPAVPPRIGLVLDIEHAESATTGAFSFEPGVLTADTIERWKARFLALAASAAAEPAQRISRLDLLPAEEVRMLSAWNATDVRDSKDACVHDLVAAQARRTPSAVAVIDERSQLTYGELDARAEGLSARLRSAGVRVETRVALALPRGAAMVVALLGIQKSGGAYVPIDLGLPGDRVRAMLADAGVTHMVTDASALDLLPHEDVKIVRIDADDPPAAGTPAPAPSRATPDNLAYVMFTSGSTGRPKGVQIPHRALVSFLESMQRQPGISAADVMLAVTTLSFDISGLELYLPLVAGARVVIASREVALDGGRLAQLVASQGVTMMQATPTTYRLLLSSGWRGSPAFKLLVGGEAVPADLVLQLLPCGSSLWNMYGPTETTIWSTCARLDGSRVVIGKPIANTQAYVLGPALERLPIGVKGELYLGGEGLARGYEGRPDLTAARFVASPFSDRGGSRLYRTGDIARFLPDGNLECLGRTDSQIKLRGFRVELGEIEHVLSTNPALKGAVVLLREDVPGDKRLVAYVVAKRRTATLSPAELADHAKAALPAYMVPSAFVILDAFPLNPSGKIDRKALAAIDLGEHRATTQYEVPSSEIESTISTVWGEVLGVPRVGRSDNFFDLGGNSLLALQVHGKLVARLGKEFPILNLFTYTTVASLASYLSGVGTAAPAKARAPAGRDALLDQGAQRRAQRKNRRAGGGS